MQKIKVYVSIIFLVFGISSSHADNASFIFNDQTKIDSCKGKMRLELVRIWGGDDEEDENKYFRTPADIVIGRSGTVNIIDRYLHHYKVFDREGKYLRTVGQKGRGPGDMYAPMFMFASPGGDIGIREFGTFRVQIFSPEGKSKKIFKIKNIINWIGVNSKNQFMVYNRNESFYSKKILSVWNKKGKTIGTIGVMHDKNTHPRFIDKYHCVLDAQDNVYILNQLAPVIRKYSPEGTLLQVITFQSPKEISIKVTLNKKGDEIVRDEPQAETNEIVVKKGKTGIYINKTGTRRTAICQSIGVDSENRIFVIAGVKTLSKEDLKKCPMTSSTRDFVKVENTEYVDEIYKGFYRIYVFNPQGEILATAPYDAPIKKTYMHGNRLFVVDAFIKKRIMEYRYRFANSPTAY